MRSLSAFVLLSLAVSVEVAAKGAATQDHKVIVDRVAAVVNDAVILMSELDVRMLPLRGEAAKISDQAERERRLTQLALQMLDAMVNDELVVQAAIEAKITVTADELKTTVDYIKSQNKLDDKQLEIAMKQQGITMSSLRNDVLRQRAIQQIIGPKLAVTDEEVRARYDQLRRRSASVAAVNVSQILFALPEHATEQQQNDAKRKAQRAIERARAGEDFATLAGELTDDASTKTTGGMLGWFDSGTITPEWEPIVFGMDKGDVRGPIPGENGIYVLFANEIKRTPLEPYAAMKDPLRRELEQKSRTKLTQAWIEELRKKAYVDIKLR